MQNAAHCLCLEIGNPRPRRVTHWVCVVSKAPVGFVGGQQRLGFPHCLPPLLVLQSVPSPRAEQLCRSPQVLHRDLKDGSNKCSGKIPQPQDPPPSAFQTLETCTHTHLSGGLHSLSPVHWRQAVAVALGGSDPTGPSRLCLAALHHPPDPQHRAQHAAWRGRASVLVAWADPVRVLLPRPTTTLPCVCSTWASSRTPCGSWRPWSSRTPGTTCTRACSST